jgi:hypothetical protein
MIAKAYGSVEHWILLLESLSKPCLVQSWCRRNVVRGCDDNERRNGRRLQPISNRKNAIIIRHKIYKMCLFWLK